MLTWTAEQVITEICGKSLTTQISIFDLSVWGSGQERSVVLTCMLSQTSSFAVRGRMLSSLEP